MASLDLKAKYFHVSIHCQERPSAVSQMAAWTSLRCFALDVNHLSYVLTCFLWFLLWGVCILHTTSDIFQLVIVHTHSSLPALIFYSCVMTLGPGSTCGAQISSPNKLWSNWVNWLTHWGNNLPCELLDQQVRGGIGIINLLHPPAQQWQQVLDHKT